jgi:hypothetical protein
VTEADTNSEHRAKREIGSFAEASTDSLTTRPVTAAPLKKRQRARATRDSQSGQLRIQFERIAQLQAEWTSCASAVARRPVLISNAAGVFDTNGRVADPAILQWSRMFVEGFAEFAANQRRLNDHRLPLLSPRVTMPTHV